MELDEIIYTALMDDEALKTLCGWQAETESSEEVPARILSTCIEVSPMDEDKTPIPYIIIAEEPSQNDQGTKDSTWESGVDIVNVGVLVCGESPKQVKLMRRMVRAAINGYVVEMVSSERPYLCSRSDDGIAWDWTKPCYHDTLHYQCEVDANIYND